MLLSTMILQAAAGAALGKAGAALGAAIAAIAAVASYKNISPNEYLSEYKTEITEGLKSFHGLPHRLEFLRELNGVRYYDDNFSTNPSSTRVAIEAFPDNNVVAIIGGRDKTDYKDIPELYEILQAPQVKKIILIYAYHRCFTNSRSGQF